MKLIKLLSFALLFGFISIAHAGVIVLEGKYMGKNIFVKNPFGGAGVGFCVFEVTINGNLSPDEVNQSAFEIDFGNHDIKVGDNVIIEIKHKDDCGADGPQVLNPEVLKPKSTFNTKKIAFNDEGVLEWKTDNENGEMDFIVEQFRWNKWIRVGEVSGIGTPGEHSYSFKITPHSGDNKARVKQIDYTGRPRYSKSTEYTSTVPAITIDGDKFKGEVSFFGGETLYEIYDKYGTIVKKGFGHTADIETLDKGLYYLSFDNTTETVTFK